MPLFPSRMALFDVIRGSWRCWRWALQGTKIVSNKALGQWQPAAPHGGALPWQAIESQFRASMPLWGASAISTRVVRQGSGQWADDPDRWVWRQGKPTGRLVGGGWEPWAQFPRGPVGGQRWSDGDMCLAGQDGISK